MPNGSVVSTWSCPKWGGQNRNVNVFSVDNLASFERFSKILERSSYIKCFGVETGCSATFEARLERTDLTIPDTSPQCYESASASSRSQQILIKWVVGFMIWLKWETNPSCDEEALEAIFKMFLLSSLSGLQGVSQVRLDYWGWRLSLKYYKV